MDVSDKFILLEQGDGETQLRIASDFPAAGIPYAEKILSVVEDAERDTGIHFPRPLVFQGYFPETYIPLGVSDSGHLHVSIGLAMAEVDAELLKAGLYHEMFHVEEEKRLRNEPYNFGASYDTFLKNWDIALDEAEKVPIALRESWFNELKANTWATHCLHGNEEIQNVWMEFIYNHTESVSKEAAKATGKEPAKNLKKEELYAPPEIDAEFRKIFSKAYKGIKDKSQSLEAEIGEPYKSGTFDTHPYKETGSQSQSKKTSLDAPQPPDINMQKALEQFNREKGTLSGDHPPDVRDKSNRIDPPPRYV